MISFRYMNLRLISLLFIVIITSISSCNDDPVGYKDPTLSPYVDRFIEQATLHGQNISARELNVDFQQLKNLCGQYDGKQAVFISPGCWDVAPESAREALMFHELGHALLKRDHKTTTLPNGEHASIMTPDPSMLYNEYTAKKRSYYFQELFEPNTIAPDWSLPKTNATIVLEDDIELTNEWQFKLSGSPNHVHEISTSVSDSPSSSLAITSLGVGEGYSYWTYSFTPANISEGSLLEVKIKLKREGVTGEGAILTIRGDVTGDPYPAFIFSTQNHLLLTGTDVNFVEYSLTVPYFPSRLDKLNIYLILMGSSEGSVYFDDVTVIKYD